MIHINNFYVCKYLQYMFCVILKFIFSLRLDTMGTSILAEVPKSLGLVWSTNTKFQFQWWIFLYSISYNWIYFLEGSLRFMTDWSFLLLSQIILDASVKTEVNNVHIVLTIHIRYSKISQSFKYLWLSELRRNFQARTISSYTYQMFQIFMQCYIHMYILVYYMNTTNMLSLCLCVCVCGCFVLKINLFNFLSDNRRSCHSTRLPSEQCVHKISVSIIFLLLTNIENVFSVISLWVTANTYEYRYLPCMCCMCLC